MKFSLASCAIGGGEQPPLVAVQSNDYTYLPSGVKTLTLSSASSSPLLFVADTATSVNIVDSAEGKVYFLDDGGTVTTCTITGTPAVINLTLPAVAEMVIPGGVVDITLDVGSLTSLTVPANVTSLNVNFATLTSFTFGYPSSALTNLVINSGATEISDDILFKCDDSLSNGTTAVITITGTPPTKTNAIRVSGSPSSSPNGFNFTHNGAETYLTIGDSADDPAPNVIAFTGGTYVGDATFYSSLAAYLNGLSLGFYCSPGATGCLIFGNDTDLFAIIFPPGGASATLGNRYAFTLTEKGATVTTP